MRLGARLGGKILVSFLSLDLMLVAVGVTNLISQRNLHTSVTTVSTRDITPLADLRKAQNAGYGATVTGLVTALTTDPAVRGLMISRGNQYAAQADAWQQAALAHSPAVLKAQTQEVIDTYGQFIAADMAYSARSVTETQTLAGDVAAMGSALQRLVGGSGSEPQRRAPSAPLVSRP